jgi:hypothetical protein
MGDVIKRGDMKRLLLAIFVSYQIGEPIARSQQIQELSSPPRDPSAIAIVERSLAALGAGNLSSGDSATMTGALELIGKSTKTFPIAIKVRGTSELRSELTTPAGIRVTVITGTSGGGGTIRKPDGNIRSLATENVVGYRNQYLPALSLLSEVEHTSTSVEYLGVADVDGSAADIVALGVWSGDINTTASALAQTTRTIFYIDKATGLVLRLQQLHYSEKVRGDTNKMEVRFDGYRSIQGVQVPFHQQTYVDGTLLIDLKFSSVELHVAVSDNDFLAQ